MRICKICGEGKPLTDFYKTPRGHYHGKCRKCYISLQQQKYDPVKKREYNLKRLYGITLDDYDRMLQDQQGSCKLCGTLDPGGRQSGRGKVHVFFVDHCHKTGRIRGLLCNTCNKAIGQVGENLDFFTNAIIYLKPPMTPLPGIPQAHPQPPNSSTPTVSRTSSNG
jgi:hypothetical protein